MTDSSAVHVINGEPLESLGERLNAATEPHVVVVDLTRRASDERRRTLEVVRHAAADGGVPILVVLPADARHDVQELLALGADDFLFAPVDPDELAARAVAATERAGGRPHELESGPLLRIWLAGSVRVEVGEHVAIDRHYARRRAKALFVYLYLNRFREVSKYQLLADLWPEAEDAEPGRVKHTIQVLRATLEAALPGAGWHFIQEHAGAYSFNPEADRYSDMEEFETELALARQARKDGDPRTALTRYRQAIDLRKGPFLSEFRYDDWAAADSARLQESFLLALEEGARLEADQGAYDRAIELLRRAIAEDALHESSYVELMRCLWLDRRRTDALRVYHRLRDVLAKKLGVEPQAQTVRLYEQIRRDQAIAV
jgi:DNA-binding SARP family transcriptional activator